MLGEGKHFRARWEKRVNERRTVVGVKTDELEESGRSESIEGLMASFHGFGKPWKGSKQRKNIARF